MDAIRSNPAGKGVTQTSGHCGPSATREGWLRPWDQRTSVEQGYSRLVVEEIPRQEEATRFAKAVAQAKQGQWMRWEGVEKKNISWKEL
ncbi:hypothetical protein N1851_012378 [Merluccius polli]|uniref:Uncharacterized protein n=1 Tax=Merluccius polli TaxID=89951 RepID=A0AA47MXL4_MERPO|nr:hypothetical protein N1851_012378 [Merluccius polli]